MTITIDLPDAARERLAQEAEKSGTTAEALAQRVLVERFSPANRMAHCIETMAALSKPGVVLSDVSREGIYDE